MYCNNWGLCPVSKQNSYSCATYQQSMLLAVRVIFVKCFSRYVVPK